MHAAVIARIGDRTIKAHVEPKISKRRFRPVVVPVTAFQVDRLKRERRVRLALPDGVAALAQ